MQYTCIYKSGQPDSEYFAPPPLQNCFLRACQAISQEVINYSGHFAKELQIIEAIFNNFGKN